MLFPKEIRPRIQRPILYSPESSPQKSQMTILDGNINRFEEIPLEKQRALSHKKLSIVSSTCKAPIRSSKPQPLNLDINKFYRNPSKNSLTIGSKKFAFEEKDQKFSLKSSTFNIKTLKQIETGKNINTMTNIHPPQASLESYYAEKFENLNSYFQRQLTNQTKTITILQTKITQLNSQLNEKNQQVNSCANYLKEIEEKYLDSKIKICELQQITRCKDIKLVESQENINQKIEKLSRLVQDRGFYKFQQLSMKLNKWINTNEQKIRTIQFIEQNREDKIKHLKIKLEETEQQIAKIENFCLSHKSQDSLTKQSIQGSNWQELSDFVPNFANNSRFNNFSNLSFADDYFFHPKSQVIEEQFLHSESSFRSTSRDMQQNLNQTLRKAIKILEIYEQPLPCIIDKQRRIVNMITNEYLINQKGLEFVMDYEDIQYLVESGFLKVLKRFDNESFTKQKQSNKLY